MKHCNHISMKRYLIYYIDMINKYRVNKIREINLEYGKPDSLSAVAILKNDLMTFARQKSKAVIIIHGYGSTGTGGAIKQGVRRLITDNSMKGIVRDYSGGESWSYNKKRLTAMCPDLSKHESRIHNNPGVTIVILR